MLAAEQPVLKLYPKKRLDNSAIGNVSYRTERRSTYLRSVANCHRVMARACFGEGTGWGIWANFGSR